MEATHTIRGTVAQVEQMRAKVAREPALAQALREVKRFQGQRFAASYGDLLESDQYQAAACFFLEELYSDKDYSERDTQFARIAAALERLFPQPVVQTAVTMAHLHGLTEELDLAMAQHWQAQAPGDASARYLKAWRAVGRMPERRTQLASVLALGTDLEELTRKPGLHRMLKMMRTPARLAGLESLQRFLECGFATFAAMARKPGSARHFLDTVGQRESALMSLLFESDPVACETELRCLLGQAR